MANDVYYTKSFSVHKIKEKELYEFLAKKSQEGNVAIYIRDLIKRDMLGLSPSNSNSNPAIQGDMENTINHIIEKKVNELVAIKVEDVLSKMAKNNSLGITDEAVLCKNNDDTSENTLYDDALGVTNTEIGILDSIDLTDILNK